MITPHHYIVQYMWNSRKELGKQIKRSAESQFGENQQLGNNSAVTNMEMVIPIGKVALWR